MMKIQITPLAELKLKQHLGSQPGIFKLFYDTVGCGCDGINVLLIVNHAGEGEVPVEAGQLPFIISRQQEIFYEEQLKLDAEEHFSSYKLSSNSQIYGSNILVRDVRNTGGRAATYGVTCEASPAAP
jgi:uncharacterized protein YqkB